MLKKCASRIYMILIFAFLYLPIVVLIALSFNDSRSKVKWIWLTTVDGKVINCLCHLACIGAISYVLFLGGNYWFAVLFF